MRVVGSLFGHGIPFNAVPLWMAGWGFILELDSIYWGKL